ncbi:hypothetical protein ACFQMA_23115 [Halosimplex aquaticum]|uniref:Uncharacterized protein n=1 Tax=Halosimplex aquaticum TaxID=3026162 RepID=A0ABD5YB21_9EURY|nr:hypothetical protein [Halosimplex aquaticum]
MSDNNNSIGIGAAEWREVAEGRLTDNNRVYPLAPFLEGRPLYRYMHYKRRYPRLLEINEEAEIDLPPTFEQSQYCQNLVAAHGSPVASRAVRNGNLAVLSWLSGLTRRDADFSSAQVFSRVVRDLRRDGYLGVFLGQTDGGKTNSALVAAGLHLRDQSDAILATNVTTLEWQEPELNERTKEVESRSELENLCDEQEDVVAVLDEMSTQANAQTQSYEVNDEFYPLVTFKSKLGLRMFIIGHREDGYDIAPPIRSHADHVIVQRAEETGLDETEYRAEFYRDLVDGEPEDLAYQLDPVPPIAGTYDPDEQAEFDISG